MTLSDLEWKSFTGAYGVTYDVSKPLKRLEAANGSPSHTRIWEELWVELHHKGSVGTASYLAVPQLIRISIEKNISDWNILALCSVIDQQRVLGDSPQLPSKFNDLYFNAITDMKKIALDVLDSETNDLTKTVAMSALATANGQLQLGKAIMQFADEELLEEFLIQF